MDTTPRRDWSWLPTQMPRIAAALAEQRRVHGDAWINLCWRRGVTEGIPGWFYAGEGALTVGTPWADATVLEWFGSARQAFPDATILLLRDREAAHAQA